MAPATGGVGAAIAEDIYVTKPIAEWSALASSLTALVIVSAMGVSGSGKTTVAALGWQFQEGDDLIQSRLVARHEHLGKRQATGDRA